MSARELYQQQVTDLLQKFNSQIDRLQAQVIESDILAEEQLRKRIEELTKKEFDSQPQFTNMPNLPSVIVL